MPKPPFKDPALSILEGEIIETLRAGLKLYRRDLDFPESNSDMQAMVRGLLRRFKVERRPLDVDLEFEE